MPTGNQNQTRMTGQAQQAPRKRTEEDVLQLLLEYRRNRNERLRDRIVLQYTNLVESVARRFAGSAEPVEDLAQEGYIGLITAVELYDPAKNVKFSTYATHFIIGQIKHYLRDRGKIIKEPAWLQELNQRMTRAIETLSQQLSRPPTHQEIASLMDMTEEAVAEIMMTREVFKVTSIDGGSDSDDDNGSAIDIERKQTQDVAIAFQLPVEDRIVLEAAIEKLKSLEQRVLVEFYFKDLNQTEIARQMGISCNYVSHLLRNSTKKLKKILTTEDLRSTQLKITQMRRRFEDQVYSDNNLIVDPQTGLYNRGYYEMRLPEELSRAARLTTEVAVLIVGIGGLDPFFRQHGTLRGDEAVKGIAATISNTVRRSDIVTRYESDLFALILPYTGSRVSVVCSRVETALTDWLETNECDSGRTPLWLGFGATSCPDDSNQAATLTEIALRACRRDLEPYALPLAA
jgi:RNA polymerase sigma-B factor